MFNYFFKRRHSSPDPGGLRPPDPPVRLERPTADLSVFLIFRNHAKKLDLGERIFLVQSRASNSPRVSRYGPSKFGPFRLNMVFGGAGAQGTAFIEVRFCHGLYNSRRYALEK